MKNPLLASLGLFGLLALPTSAFAFDERGGVSGGGGTEGGTEEGDLILEDNPETIVIQCKSGAILVFEKESLLGSGELTSLIRQVCAQNNGD